MTDDKPIGFAYYEKVATDAGGNIAFAFIGLGVIWLCGRFWPGVSKVLFWVATALTALNVIHFILVLAAGTIAWSTKRLTPLAENHPGWKWLWAATAARLFEQILCLLALYLAARVIGYLR
jgi:hypothetical protein